MKTKKILSINFNFKLCLIAAIIPCLACSCDNNKNQDKSSLARLKEVLSKPISKSGKLENVITPYYLGSEGYSNVVNELVKENKIDPERILNKRQMKRIVKQYARRIRRANRERKDPTDSIADKADLGQETFVIYFEKDLLDALYDQAVEAAKIGPNEEKPLGFIGIFSVDLKGENSKVMAENKQQEPKHQTMILIPCCDSTNKVLKIGDNGVEGAQRWTVASKNVNQVIKQNGKQLDKDVEEYFNEIGITQ